MISSFVFFYSFRFKFSPVLQTMPFGIFPDLISSSFSNNERTEDLPAPTGPTMAVNLPVGNLKEISSSAFKSD